MLYPKFDHLNKQKKKTSNKTPSKQIHQNQKFTMYLTFKVHSSVEFCKKKHANTHQHFVYLKKPQQYLNFNLF